MRITQAINQRGREPTARTVAANRNVLSDEALPAKKAPCRKCIIQAAGNGCSGANR